jgi:hypothetical protein
MQAAEPEYSSLAEDGGEEQGTSVCRVEYINCSEVDVEVERLPPELGRLDGPRDQSAPIQHRRLEPRANRPYDKVARSVNFFC